MRLARLHLFAIICMTAIAAFVAGVAAFVVDLVFETLASAARIVAPAPRLALDGGSMLYDAPPIHSLRHEANVSRRSADRHT